MESKAGADCLRPEGKAGISATWRALILLTLGLALLTGIIKPWLPAPTYGWASLHIFLFNLTAGGFLVLTRLSAPASSSKLSALFFLGSLVFSLAAFFHVFLVCLVCAVALGVLAEVVRGQRFSWFPREFFQRAPVARKFQQAAALCLSLGLFICALTLLNQERLKLFSLPKLDLHVFYLGFSFPLSLLAFSTIFSRLEGSEQPVSFLVREYCFWALNLGVIVFFFFIIFQVYPGQMAMALVLFSVVCITLFLHLRRSQRDLTFWFLLSGLIFLALGSLTGIGYIIELWRSLARPAGYLLSLHSAATLFGWNLSWIFLVILEPEKNPSRWRGQNLRPKHAVSLLVLLHWVMVLLLPLGRNHRGLGIVVMALGIALLSLVFFLSGREREGERGSK